MKKILLLLLCVLAFAMNANVTEAGYVDPQVSNIVYKVMKDKSWYTVNKDSNHGLQFNTRYMHIEGSRKKPKIDVWIAYFNNGNLCNINRIRYYFQSTKIESKTLMIASFDSDYSLNNCYQTGLQAVKEDVKTGTIGYNVANKIYDFCYRAGYLKTLK